MVRLASIRENGTPAETRQEWQEEIDALVVKIGESTLSAELLAALYSRAAVCDDSGKFVEQARCWMSAGG